MSECCISSDQNDLPKRTAEAAFFQKPEESFDGHIHNAVGSLLAGRAMNDMSNVGHGRAHRVPVRDTSRHNLKPLARFRQALVTESANRYIAMVFGLKDAMDKMGTHFAGRASHQDVLHRSAIPSMLLPSTFERQSPAE